MDSDEYFFLEDIKMLVLSIVMILYTRSSTTFFHNNKKITLIS